MQKQYIDMYYPPGGDDNPPTMPSLLGNSRHPTNCFLFRKLRESSAHCIKRLQFMY